MDQIITFFIGKFMGIVLYRQLEIIYKKMCRDFSSQAYKPTNGNFIRGNFIFKTI